MIIKNFLSIANKYIKHNLKAKSKKGHGIHSPFVFELCSSVFSLRKSRIKEVERIRKQLLRSKEKITFTDIGAGSHVETQKTRMIKEIARFSSNKKINKLLYKLVNHLKPSTIIEFGTSFGFSTMYMAKANPEAKIFTIEGVPEIAKIAKDNFTKLRVDNIQLINSGFDECLEKIEDEYKDRVLVFLDGNHKKEPTLKYFNNVINHISEESVIIIDDINWSEEMNEAWGIIKKSAHVMLTIDLFFVGIVFFKKNIFKQNFKIRF